MAKGGFFKNYRVYILTTVAYMGALLFGTLFLLFDTRLSTTFVVLCFGLSFLKRRFCTPYETSTC
jgi:hypothetical protein